MVEVTQKPGDSGTVVKTGHSREVEAMEVKWKGEEGRIEMERKTKVVMYLMCNGGVERVGIGTQQRLEGEPGANARDQAQLQLLKR